LEEKLMVKVISSKDRRGKIIQLTEIGEELYKVCRKRITELEHNLIDGDHHDICYGKLSCFT